MNRSRIFLTFLLWLCMVYTAMGQQAPQHDHKHGENCLRCRATEVNEKALEKEAEYLRTHKSKALKSRTVGITNPPDNFEYVIPIVFHVFGTEFNNGTKVSVDLIRKALEETNKDYWGMQEDWQQLVPARDSIKCPLKMTFRLAEKDPDGNATTGVTFHDWAAGFGDDSRYDSEIQKYAWDNYRYVNIYIMQDLYADEQTNNSGVAWYPSIRMSDANLARVVYNGSYLGSNTDGEFRSVLTHELGHFFNLMHTFEGCDDAYTYPNDEIDDTPVHKKDNGQKLQEGAKNPFGEVIDVCNFMNYPRLYKNFTRDQVARMKAALLHDARVTLWQEENHKKVFYMDPTPRLEVAEGTVLEGRKNDGSFTEMYGIKMIDSKLKVAEGEYVSAEDYTVTGLPAGLTLKLKAAAEGMLEGELVGSATAHDASNNGSLSVTLKNSVLVEGKLLNPTFELLYTFRVPYAIVYQDIDDILVSPSNTWTFFSLEAGTAEYGAWYSNNGDIVDCYKLQTYKKPLVVYPNTLNIKPLELGAVIDGDADWVTPKDDYLGVPDLKSPEYNEWVGKNAYVGIQFEINGEVIYGWMNISFNAAGNGYTIHDAAYNTEPEGAIKAGETKDGILEKVQISPTEITEAIVNDGTIADKISLKILGVKSEFTKTGELVAGTDYTVSGIPEGLTLKLSLTDKMNGVAELSGKAVKHDKADNTVIKLALNKALVNNEVGGLSADIKVTYKAPYGIFYKDIPDVWLSPDGVWTDFGFGIGDANYELWYAEKLDNKYKFVSANNPLVAYTGTSNIVPLAFGKQIGEKTEEGMSWIQQKTGVPQAEIDESMLDLKSKDFLEWLGQTAYVGVQFQENGLIHYGWVGIRFEADGYRLYLEDWAYNEAPGEAIAAGYKKKDQSPYMSWSTNTIYEKSANDGRVDSLTAKVKGTTFALAAKEKLQEGTHYTSDNLPAGISLSVVVLDELTAQIQLNGKVTNNAVADSLKDWKLSFKDAAFKQSPVSEKEQKFNWYFRDPYKIIYVDMEDILCDKVNTFKSFLPVAGFEDLKFAAWYDEVERTLRFETYGQNIICTNDDPSTAYVRPLDKGYLVSKTDMWNTGDDYPYEHWIWGPAHKDWAGTEAYLGFAFQMDEDFQFGWVRIAVAADGTSYVIKDYAYHTGPGVPIRTGDSGVGGFSFLVNSGTAFHESWNNDGLIRDTIRTELVFGEFAKSSGLLTAGTDYTVTGLIPGLTLKAELKAADVVILTLEGKVTAHDKAASVKNMKITFTDAALAAGTQLADKTVNLGIEMLDPYKVVYEDFKDIECSRYNFWTLLNVNGNSYGIWYDIDNGLSLRLETYTAPVICEGSSRNISVLKAGEVVGAGSNWVNGGEYPDEHNICSPNYADWKGKEGYIGIKYDFNGYTRYGWIRIEVAEDGQSYVVKDLAYNEFFDEPIMTGAKERKDLIVAYSADKVSTYETFEVQFTNHSYSSKEVVRYAWTFEGGTPATFEGQTPDKIAYTSAGTYDVSLEIETADTTITVLKSDYITILPVMLKADFTASASGIVKGQKVNFADASEGSFDVVKWEWTFEGGQPASFEGKNPGEVVYAQAGEYEVILKVTDVKGKTHTRFASPAVIVYDENYRGYCPVTVECPGNDNSYCYITEVGIGEKNNASDFGGYTDYSQDVQFSVTKGESSNLSIKLAGGNGGSLSAWVDWNGDGVFDGATETVADFNDGEEYPDPLVINVPEDAVSGMTGMRVRTRIGSQYGPCDDEGYYGEVEDYVVVIGSRPAHGDITADKQNIRSGESVNFRANINDITGEGVVAYQWTFAGAVNTTSTERIPAMVQYAEVGVHDVTLELTLENGEKKVVEKKAFIVVNPTVILAAFTASASDITTDGQVTFTDASESSAEIVGWAWEFEGGSPATFSGQTPPAIAYSQAGLYEVMLTITDANGQKHMRVQPMMVKVYENQNAYCEIEEGGSYYSIVKVAVGDQKHETEQVPATYVNDFTDFAFTIEKGKAQKFDVLLSDNMKESEVHVMAWVDWNQDGTFDEDSETVANYKDNEKPADLMITVPEDAEIGAMRMRVRSDYWNYLKPCDKMSSMGELEDYTLIVKEARPSGYIVADNTNPAIAEEVHFTAFVNQITNDEVAAYQWTFTGGAPATSTVRKPAAVTYAAEGVYDVSLDLALANGGKKHITMYDFITVGVKAPEVSVDFTASPTEINEEGSVSYTAIATGGVVSSYTWAFEGGSPLTATGNKVDGVTYADQGAYDVTLTAVLEDGSTVVAQKSNYITVNPFLLKADFTASAVKVNSGADVVFTNTSIGAESYSWNFGDGSAVSTDENPTHAFADGGIYSVKLTVTKGADTHSKSLPIVVSALKSACEPQGGSYSGVYLQSVQFGEVIHADERDRNNATGFFDFTGAEPFTMAAGETVNYAINEPYAETNVHVWVDWNNDGTFDGTEEHVIEVKSVQDEILQGTISVPAGLSDRTIRMRILVDMYGGSTPCGNSNVWEIEDHVVQIGAAGVEETVMTVVADKPVVMENETLALSVEGAPVDAAYAWTLTGAETESSTDAIPAVRYPAPGAYDVKVVVTPTDGTARTLEESRFIVVNRAKISADFKADKKLCALGEEVLFTSTSTASAAIQSLEWTFEGATPASSTDAAPVATYAAAGKYDVTLKVTDEFGKTDTKVVSEMVVVKEFVKADFTVVNTAVSVGDPIAFTNRSTAAVSYAWTFDNGEPATSTEKNPTVSFKSTGAAMVTLVATDADGKRSVKTLIMDVVQKAFGAIQLDELIQTYDGTEKAVVVITTPADLVEHVKVVYTQNGEVVKPIESGIYDVTATYTGTKPYDVPEVKAKLEVKKVAIELVASKLRQTYTGSPQQAVVKTVPAGYEQYVTVKYLKDGEEVEPKDCGTYQLQATVTGANYEAKAMNENFVVCKITGEVELTLKKVYVYDGNAKLVDAVVTTPADLAVELTYNGSSEKPVDAGSYRVVANIVDSNYEGLDEGEMVILPATPVLKVIQKEFVYDGQHHAPLFTTDPADQDYKISYRKEGIDVGFVIEGGVYEYTVKILNGNYKGSVTGNMKITPAKALIQVSGLRNLYDGSTKEVSVVTTPAELPVVVTYNGFSSLPYAVGEYTVLVEASSANYYGLKTAVMQIVNAAADLKVMDLVISDGTHDCIFRVPELAGLDKSLVVYNKLGGIVYEAKEYYDNFDMRDLPAGTYYYILKYVENGEQQVIKSFVEVIRK